ncbi:hypothetical protein [Deinococcus sp.]|uniref:hypothetical protein n=1 Tax=Deinococcus sp. TaxID=47478 RepID=UPI0025BE82DC|nr:hypothetical protein [Deinococcus sp.]
MRPIAPPARQAITTWPTMIARLGSGSGTEVAQTVPARTFARLHVIAAYDSHAAFNNATSIYTTPQKGLYRLGGKVRVVDGGMPQGSGLGLGIDFQERDGHSFFWGVANANRQGVINQRVVGLSEGTILRLFIYADHPVAATVDIASAEFTVERIR